MEQIPKEYLDYLDVFRKREDNEMLSAYKPWDLVVETELGKEILFGRVYQLTVTK